MDLFSLHLIKRKFGPNYDIMTKNWIEGKIQKEWTFYVFFRNGTEYGHAARVDHLR